MAFTAWVGSSEFYPGNIVPGFEFEAVFGTGTLSGGGTLTGVGSKGGPGTGILSGGGTGTGTGVKHGLGTGLLSGGGTLTSAGAPNQFTFTALVGHPASTPGNIIPGLGSVPVAVVATQVGGEFYRVQVFEFGDNFGIGPLLVEFDRPHAIGYGDYNNNVPEAFFSLHQDDPKIRALRGYEGRAHVRILREGQVAWTGWVALERDANPSDVIFYCYGYLAGVYWQHSAWKQEFENATTGAIVADMWDRAKNFSAFSRLGFVATGIIQDPPTVQGGGTEITLPIYEAYYKRILFVLQEMAAIGASDTGNSTTFEITHSETPTFNYWTDRRNDLVRVRWEFGDGRVQSFREYGMPVWHRNAILAVGQQPRDLLLQHTEQDTVDMEEWGRMEESLFLAWVRDEDELERVTKLRAEKALRDDINLVLTFFPGAEFPPGLIQSRWAKGDTVRVKIDRGITNIDHRLQIIGYMVVAMGGREQVRVILQEPL